MEDDNLNNGVNPATEADNSATSIEPDTTMNELMEDVNDPELRTNGLEVVEARKDVWGGEPVVQPSPNFRIEKEPSNPVIEETEDNVEIGFNHINESLNQTEELQTSPTEQPVASEPADVVDTPTEETPTTSEPEIATPNAIVPPTDTSKKPNKILIIAAGVLAVICIGILIFVFVKK